MHNRLLSSSGNVSSSSYRHFNGSDDSAILAMAVAQPNDRKEQFDQTIHFAMVSTIPIIKMTE
jgi:hypothetical protein